MTVTKEQRFGIISATIFLACFFGLLLIFGFSSPFPPPQEEGILINFGTDETGSGDVEPRPAEEQKQIESVPEQTTPPPPVKTTEKTEEVVTQDFEKTAVLEEKKRKEREAQAEIKRKKEIEDQKKQEDIALQKKEEERIKQEQQQKAIDARAKNSFGGKNPTGDNTGEGNAGGTGNQGDPNGDINSKNRIGGPADGKGVSFSLAGRSHKSLPVPPKIHKTEGKVVVEVRVDQNGNVVSARAGVPGTTLSDEAVWNVAEDAARKATFDMNKNAPAIQQGTITYYFEFE